MDRRTTAGSSNNLKVLLQRFAAHHMQTTLQLAVGQTLCFLLVFVG
jgi:hypothetical protein